jgi:hypothetical protein
MSTAAIQPMTSVAALATALGDAPVAVIVVGLRSQKNAGGSVTTPLLYPIQSEGASLGKITMRRPTVKELRAVSGLGDFERVATLVGALAQLPPSSIDQIDAEDFGELGEVIASFFPKSPKTGAAKP